MVLLVDAQAVKEVVPTLFCGSYRYETKCLVRRWALACSYMPILLRMVRMHYSH